MRRNFAAVLLRLFVFALAAVLPAQAAPQETPGTETPAESKKLPEIGPPSNVPRAADPVVVDGVLSDSAWQGALRMNLPWEVNPGINIPTTVQTVALITYDDSHLYVAFEAYDAAPKSIRARLSDRDTAFQDDFVGVVLDTFNDARRGFEFFVNPMGVQMDLVMDDVNGNEDSSWDAIWDSAGSFTEDGYRVEMAIPFTSLRFQRADASQIWGLDLIRIYPRDRRYLLSNNKRDRDISCYLCQIGKIEGFDGATPGKNLEVTPTVTAIKTDAAESLGAELETGETDTEAGITARWGMTPNMVASGTINPDFSQVEADAAQLDVNEQFALFFPEKRPFFLEAADYFGTPLTTVHTRTIADPDWGAKLTGNAPGNAIGAFIAQDDRTNILFPGSQSSDSVSMETESTAGVARYRRDIGKTSVLGGVVTVRQSGEVPDAQNGIDEDPNNLIPGSRDYSNGVAGVDALFRPVPAATIRVQALYSQTDYPAEVASAFGQPEGTLSDTAFYGLYSHDKQNWSAWGRYQQIGTDFRSDLGFIPQADVRQPVAGYEYRWIGDPGDWYSRIGVGADWDQTSEMDGDLIERETEAWTFVSGPLQSWLFLGGGVRDRVYLSERFDQSFMNWSIEFWPWSDLYLSLNGGVSDRVDFAFFDPLDEDAARQGDELRWSIFTRYNLGRRVRIDLEYEQRTLSIDEGKLFLAGLSQLRLAYQINRRTFVRLILQHEDVERDVDLYPDCGGDPLAAGPVDCGLTPESTNLFTQFLFSYKINPQTAVYLGYTDNRAGLDEFVDPGTGPELQQTDLTQTDRTFFFKIGYAWVR